MVLLAVRCFGLLLLGLASGASLCVVFIERGLGDSWPFYVTYKQLMIRTLTVPLPVIGLLGSVAVLVDCGAQWRDGVSTAFWLTPAAFIFSVAAAVVTKAGHFPLNAVIARWDPAAPPSAWKSVQARWSALHLARTAVGILSSLLLIASNLAR